MAEDTALEAVLEKIRVLATKPVENAELLRSNTAKLLARITTSDMKCMKVRKSHRKIKTEPQARDSASRQATLQRLWSKNSSSLVVLAGLLEICRDLPTCNNVASILREAICLKSSKASRKKDCALKKSSVDMLEDVETNNILCEVSGSSTQSLSSLDLVAKDSVTKRASNTPRLEAITNLVKQNVSSMLIKTVIQISIKREPNNINLETLLYDTLWILNQVAQKDPKFPLKLRTFGGVKILHSILKTHYTNTKVVFPLLSIMKILSKSPCTSSILIRDDIVTTYDKILIVLNHAPSIRLRLCLDTIDYLSRNRVCCVQMAKAGFVIALLKIFDRWEKYDGKTRVKIVLRILQTLQHISVTQSGRKVLANKKHIQTLHRFCMSCSEEEHFDKLVTKCSYIICHTLNNRTLPISSKNPAIFDLALIECEDCPSMNQEIDNEPTPLDLSSSDDEDYEIDYKDLLSKVDSDSDIENALQMSDDSSTNINTTFYFQTSLRDVEDLKRYNHLFKEFTVVQKQMKLYKSFTAKENSLDKPLNNLTSSQNSLHNQRNSYMDNNVCEFDYVLQSCQASADSYGNLQQDSVIFQQLFAFHTHEDVYLAVASKVRSIIPFVKVAYPDMIGADAIDVPEFLHFTDKLSYRKKILTVIERAISPDNSINEVVFNLDQYVNQSQSTQSNKLDNNDTLRLVTKQFNPNKKLEFESRFESGNLRKAIQIGSREYNLILTPDVNSSKRYLWFYFEVSNMMSGCSYTFNIINCEKADSQFNFGMMPVMFSVKDATLGKPGWQRVGTDICYYRNSYQFLKTRNPAHYFYTVTFTIEFPHSNDVCYIAYHYPYTYSRMMTKIWLLSLDLPRGIFYRLDTLCYSLNKNEVPLITITGEETPSNRIHDREIIFLTARIHPGESNASWVMDGTLSTLLDSSLLSFNLRSNYVFKIVPMLNVEGVINGCYRCGLTNEDLNRRWSKPSQMLHPDIFHTKGLLEYASLALRRPAALFCDFHGHSRKKNVFLYGCSNAESWCPADRENTSRENITKYMALAVLMHQTCGAFSLPSCSFSVERDRESTARVTIWRQLRIERSYTLEASFCGFDQGPYKGLQVNTQHLKKVGRDLCSALQRLREDLPADLIELIEQKGSKCEESDASSEESAISLSDDETDVI